MTLQIDVGQYSALNTLMANACYGYYVMKFLGKSYTDQESGQLLHKIRW